MEKMKETARKEAIDNLEIELYELEQKTERNSNDFTISSYKVTDNELTFEIYSYFEKDLLVKVDLKNGSYTAKTKETFDDEYNNEFWGLYETEYPKEVLEILNHFKEEFDFNSVPDNFYY